MRSKGAIIINMSDEMKNFLTEEDIIFILNPHNVHDKTRRFVAREKADEILTVIDDDIDFSNTKEYLRPLIKKTLFLFGMDGYDRVVLYNDLISGVPDAVLEYWKFMQVNKLSNTGSFCKHYFGYLSHELYQAKNNGFNIKRKPFNINKKRRANDFE